MRFNLTLSLTGSDPKKSSQKFIDINDDARESA